MALSLVQQVQLYLGDTLPDKGPRPDGLNYSSDELAEFISKGGTLTGAVIVGLKTLESEWASFALSSQEEGVSFKADLVSVRYRTLAEFYMENPISTLGKSRRTILLKRVDAYSDPQSANI